MAKRVFVYREDAIKTVSRWIKADMTLGSSLFEMMMNEIPTTTEKKIVKPYLDKLKTEITTLQDKVYDYASSKSYDDCIELIDNLLTELGEKE